MRTQNYSFLRPMTLSWKKHNFLKIKSQMPREIFSIWVFLNKWWYPQIIHGFIGVFHYKPSILGAHPYFWKHPSLPRFNPSISTCCSAWAPTAYFASLYATNPALHHSNPTLWAECWRTTLGRNGVFEEGLWGGRVCWVENYQVCSRNKGLDVWTVVLKEGFWICISQSFFFGSPNHEFWDPMSRRQVVIIHSLQ